MLRLSKKNFIKLQKGFAKGFFSALVLSSFLLVSQVSAADITSDGVIKLVNKARNEAGVPVLVKNSLLQKAAAEKAHDMFEQNYFAHISPSGKTPWDFITQAGYDYQLAGENLAINYTDLKEQQNAWMDSPLHRKNILNPDFSEIGVAVEVGVIDGHKTIVTVQEFGARVVMVANTETMPIKSVKKDESIVGMVSLPINIPMTTRNDAGSLTGLDFGNFLKVNEISSLAWVIAVLVLIVIVIVDLHVFVSKKRSDRLMLR
jgi:hypothetical protein